MYILAGTLKSAAAVKEPREMQQSSFTDLTLLGADNNALVGGFNRNHGKQTGQAPKISERTRELQKYKLKIIFVRR